MNIFFFFQKSGVCLFSLFMLGLFVVIFIVVVVVDTISRCSVSHLRCGSLLGKSLNMLLNTECAGNLKECFRLIFVVIVHVRSPSLSLSLYSSAHPSGCILYMFSHSFFYTCIVGIDAFAEVIPFY